MKKIIYGILISLVISCGGENSRYKKMSISLQDTINVAEKLHPKLLAGVQELVRSNDHLNYPDIPLNESFIAVAFLRDKENENIDYSDSIVLIDYNIFTSYEDKNYKGILEIDTFNIVIFDNGNFGNMYYNTDSIKKVSLEKFKRYPMKNFYSVSYNIKNGELLEQKIGLIITDK